MSSYDPRIIAIALEDLLQEIRLWAARASQTLTAASYIQRQAQETAQRALHRAAVLLDEAQQDEERVIKISTAAASLLAECQVGRDEALSTLNHAHAELEAATETLEFWEEELRKALAWLERAEARLARAIREYELARTAFDQAQWELNRAEARYRACMSDKDRSNCDREARALRSAQEDLQIAAHRLQMAEAEVHAAQIEVDTARARVQCCSNAVHYATQAVNVAQEAEAQAQQAVNSAERGLEFAQAAEQGALAAKEKVADELEAAEQMMTVTRDAVSMTDEAATHLALADNAEESAQRYARGAEHELEYRLQLLYQLNVPDLYSVADSIITRRKRE